MSELGEQNAEAFQIWRVIGSETPPRARGHRVPGAEVISRGEKNSDKNLYYKKWILETKTHT